MDIKTNAGLTPLNAGALRNHANVVRTFAQLGNNDARKAIAETEKTLTTPLDSRSLKNKIVHYFKRCFSAISNLIPYQIKNMGYNLAQLGIFVALPFLLGHSLLAFTGMVSLVTLLIFAGYFSLPKNFREAKVVGLTEERRDPIIDPERQNTLKVQTKDFADILGLGNVELDFDNSGENYNSALAASFSNRIIVSKRRLENDVTISSNKGIMAHEVQHLLLNKNKFLLYFGFATNGILAEMVKPMLFLTQLTRILVTISPWRIPLLSTFFVAPLTVLNFFLLPALLLHASSFIKFARIREEEIEADKGAVMLTDSKGLEEFCTDQLLCSKALLEPQYGTRYKFDPDNNYWIRYGWEQKKPLQTLFGLFTMDHPPLIDRINDIKETRKLKERYKGHPN